jgi:kinesin family member 5
MSKPDLKVGRRMPDGRYTLTRQQSMSLVNRQNVQVYCRFRPLNNSKNEVGSDIAVDIDSNGQYVQMVEQSSSKHVFPFDYVFGMQTSQEDVYEQCAAPLIHEVFEGYNCTIFAYGQTGSGKTHTMMGELETEQQGVIPRLVEEIFYGIEEADPAIEFTLQVSYIEIYNEHIRDLLNPRQDNLQLRETKEDGVYIQDVTEVYVNSNEQVLDIMHRGMRSRAIAETKMNHQSSRSHSVFILQLAQRNKETMAKKNSKLFLVDLAGSEKVKKSHAQGSRLDEAKFINKSLSALGIVIRHLTEGNPHIPYRDSKLTRLLCDSLGGNSKTSLIITCSPSAYNSEETLSTLRFGQRAKNIKNKPKVNQERSIAEYRELLNAANRDLKNQRQLIAALNQSVSQLKTALEAHDPDALAGMDLAAGDAAMLKGMDITGDRSVVQELQNRMEEFEIKLTEAAENIDLLQDEIVEKDSELDIQAQMLEDRSEEVTELKVELAMGKERMEDLEEKVAEYAVFRKKVELMEQEYIIQLDELEIENADLTEKLHALLLNEIEARHQQSLRAKARSAARPRRATRSAFLDDDKKSRPKTKELLSTPDQDIQISSPRRHRPDPNEPVPPQQAFDRLQRENRRLKEDLRAKNEQFSTMTGAFDDLKRNVDPNAVDQALKASKLSQENTTLQSEVEQLRRQVETQEKLLSNRQSHVEVLELALKEANTMHKKLDLEKRQQIDELQEKLRTAEQMFDELYEDSAALVNSGRRASNAEHHNNMVVPMRGGQLSSRDLGSSSARGSRGSNSHRAVSARGNLLTPGLGDAATAEAARKARSNIRARSSSDAPIDETY